MKKFIYKWTCVIQTQVIQGSTVFHLHFESPDYSPELWIMVNLLIENTPTYSITLSISVIIGIYRSPTPVSPAQATPLRITLP